MMQALFRLLLSFSCTMILFLKIILIAIFVIPLFDCKIIIEVKEDGVDVPACKSPAVKSRPSCRTLDYVFDGGSGLDDNTKVNIFSGKHFLKRNTNFRKIENVSLVGESKNGSVKIFCRWPNTGISFQRATNITISNLELHNCGAERNDNFSSALHLVFCNNIHISMSRFNSSTGKGISMLDVGGIVDFVYVTFYNNTGDSCNGGMYVEFTKCGALDPVTCTSQSEQQKYIHNAKFSFSFCNFLSNNYNLKNNVVDTRQNSSNEKYTKGGGMAIFLRGNSSSNSFTMKNCTFTNNSATWGGGLLIQMHDESNNNMFVFEKTDFVKNTADYAGGGIEIGMFFYDKSTFEKDNMLSFDACLFIINKAIWGGGISVRGTTRLLRHPQSTQPESLKFTACTFTMNSATVGSAFGLSTDNMNVNPLGSGTSYRVKFNSCWIINNQLIWTEDKKVIGQGAVYGEEFMLVLNETKFIQNVGTALILDSSSFTAIGNVIFKENTGLKGGALAMYGNSWIVLKAGSSLLFQANHAYEKGGAMYVHSAGPSRLAFRTTELLTSRCFLRYEDHRDENPDNWNCTIHFVNNTAPNSGGNSIFANTLEMCRRKDEPRKGNRALRWNTIKYVRTGNGFPEIVTEAVEIIVDIDQWHVAPSVPFTPSMTLLDEQNNSVYGTIMVNVSSNQHVSLRNHVFLVKDKIPYIKLDGPKSSMFNLSFITTDGQAVTTNVQAQSLNNCPAGYKQKGSGDCKCQSSETGITRCDNYNVFILKGYWLGFSNNESITRPCPLHYCRDCSPKNKLNYECKYIPGEMCAINRTGVLCSECVHNHSVVLGSEKCLPCANIYLLLIIPMVVVAFAFVIVVMYFNFDVFSGYLNAYLYAYQSVNLMLVESVQVDPFIGIVIGITCLSGTGNTLGICFFNGFSSLHKLGFNLAVPLFILLLLVLLCLCLPQKIWNKIFGGSTRMNSFGRAFSFVYVFCYTALTSKTLDLLHPIDINGKLYVFKAASVPFFGRAHLPYAIPALLVLFVFVIGFPVVLVFTPSFTNRFPSISRMEPAFNALKNCFKSPFTGKNSPNYRYFAAFYFVCRLILLLFSIFMEEETSRLVIISIFCVFFLVVFTWCQPYILQTFNFWDTVILTNLCIISLINIILSVPYVLTPAYQQLSVYAVRILVYGPLMSVFVRFISHVYRKRRIRLRRHMDYERQSDDPPSKRTLRVPFLGRKRRMRRSRIPRRLQEDEPSEFSEDKVEVR